MNTLKVFTNLENANFSKEQAKAIVGVLEDNEELLSSKLAKKEDIERLETKIAQIEAKMVTKNEMKAEIIKAKHDVIKWFIGTIMANRLIAAFLKYLEQSYVK